MQKIKKCPFCGSNAYYQTDKKAWSMVICSGCSISLPMRDEAFTDRVLQKKKTIKAWNSKS